MATSTSRQLGSQPPMSKGGEENQLWVSTNNMSKIAKFIEYIACTLLPVTFKLLILYLLLENYIFIYLLSWDMSYLFVAACELLVAKCEI